MKKISFVLVFSFLGISHPVNAIPLELHGLRPFPNIFIKLPDQIREGEKNVASLKEVRLREEEVILRYSKNSSERITKKDNDMATNRRKYHHDDSLLISERLKYSNDDPSIVSQRDLKYPDDDPSVVSQRGLKYQDDDPSVVSQRGLKYQDDDPLVVSQRGLKYQDDDPLVVSQRGLKYQDDDPLVVSQRGLKYQDDDPLVVSQRGLKYQDDDPLVVSQRGLKYQDDDPLVVSQRGLKYQDDDPSVVSQRGLKYQDDDPSVVSQRGLKYQDDDPSVVSQRGLKYQDDDPSMVSQRGLKYQDDDPSVVSQKWLKYTKAAAQYPPASKSPLIEWNDPDFINILYKKEVHLYEWDEKIRDFWVREIDENLQKDVCLNLGDSCLDTFQVGSLTDAKFAVIFVHGSIHYKKYLGVNDVGFGGNFNFLKNLVLSNDGVYFSPSFQLIPSEVKLMRKLISHIKNHSPQAKIAFACGSSGMVICSGIIKQSQSMNVDGLIFLGGSTPPKFDLALPFFEKKTPMIIAHASYDGWERMKRYYDSVKKIDSRYPIQFQLYHGGVHGTPIRMINWLNSLNYLFLR